MNTSHTVSPINILSGAKKDFELRQRRLMNSDDDLSLESSKSERTEFQDSRDVSETIVLTQLREGDCNATTEAEP